MRMTIGRWLCLPVLALVLAGCQAPPKDRPLTSEVPAPPSFTPPPEACQAAAVRFGLGLQANQALLQEMMLRAGARTARTVPATEASSTVQDPTRLNLQVEPNGRVVGAYCG